LTIASVREVFNITVPALGHVPAREQPCLLCGRREIIPLNALVLNDQRFHTVRCIHDGMRWLDPQPTEQFYQTLYGAYYHTAGPDDPLLEQATLDVHSKVEERKHIAQMRIDQVEQFGKTGRLLEVGFGNGFMLAAAAERGWQVIGLELFEVLQIDSFGLWKPQRYPGALWNMNVVSRKS
jgi:hypothetical protein